MQKRVLAALLAGIMCVGSVQVFPGMVDEVKASGETLAPDEHVESTILFESDFNNVTDNYRGAFVKEAGWTAYADENYGISAGGNDVTPKYSRMRVKEKATDDKHINFWSESGESSAIIIKHVEGASDYDKVVVEFDLRLEAGVGNDNFKFYVGEVYEDNVWTRTLRDYATDSHAYMSQVYWSYHPTKGEKFNKTVKLEFDILSEDAAEVTTYVGGDKNGETKTISLNNGMLNLALAARLFQSNGNWDEGYLDNVKVTGEKVVKTYETTLFESKFDNVSGNYKGSLIEEAGWTAYGDKDYGVSAGGNNAKPKYANIKVKDDKDYTGDKHINIWADDSETNATLVKHIEGASDFDKVTVEFKLRLEAGIGKSGFAFYVGEVVEDNVWSRYLENTSQSDVAYMSQVYWSYRPTKGEMFNNTVKLVFDILSDDAAEVTAYVGGEKQGETKCIALNDGMLNLALATSVFESSSKWDEGYLDDVVVTGTKNVREEAEVATYDKVLFHSDFQADNNKAARLPELGWDGYEGSNIWLRDKNADDYELNMWTNDATELQGVYKTVDVKAADKVAVEFALRVDAAAGSDDFKFTVGALSKDYITSYMSQEYWSCDKSDSTGSNWTTVKLEFDMITDALAAVTAFVGGEQDGEAKLVHIPNGKLNLAFVANVTKVGDNTDEIYMDDVSVYAEESVVTESVLTNAGEYTLFKSNFDKVDNDNPNNSHLVSREGWDDYTGSKMWVRNKLKPDMELNMYTESSVEQAGVYKRVYTKAADKVIVDFGLRIDAGAKSENFKFAVGSLTNNKITGSMDVEYWSCDASYNTGSDWVDVRLVFEMLTDTTANVTVSVGGEQKGEAKVVTVQKGLLNLGFIANVTKVDGNYDEAYIDDVVVTGIKEKHATTVVTESLFDADFETSVSSNGSSSLKSEGWNKGSYKFDNNDDSEYDVFPNPYNLKASGTQNSKLNINTDAKGNKSLMFKSDGGAATSRIQKVIDVTYLDNFVVEFEYQTSGEVAEGSGWYGEFQLVQNPDYVWEYDDSVEPTWNEEKNAYDVPGMVNQYEKPVKGYDAVFSATSEDEMAKARVEFDVETKTVLAYTWNDETASWELLDCAGLQVEENKVYLTFMYSAKKDGYAYLDNVNIYATKEAVDGRITDVTGKTSLVEPTMLDGASVRFAEPAGIRFKGYVNKEYIKTLKYLYGDANVKYGVVIAPYDLVNDEFTIAKLGEGNYLKIEGVKIASETDKYYQFNCAMVNVKEANWGRDFAARTYIEIKKADGTTEYVYSDFDSKDNVRSLADVATRALAAGGYSGTKKEQLEAYSVAVEPLSAGSDLRIMSMNILSERADVSEDYAGIKERAKILKETVMAYNPAVIGLQEVTSNWLNAINDGDNQLGDDYVVIQGNYKGGWFGMQTITNETAIVYDKTQVEVVTGQYGYTNNYGYISFEQDDKDHTTTWAAMQTVDGSEKFLFINAHPSYYKVGEDTNGVVQQQWNQLVTFIAELKGVYGEEFGVVLVGDFNTGYGSDEYETALANNLLDGQDAVLAGLCQGGFTCDTMHSFGKHETDLYVAHGGDDAFDHIFIDKNTPVQFKKFSVVVNDDVLNMSDHYPLYADIVLK